jgi:hypothetical protein
MDRHLIIVANAFRAGGVVVGVPSLIVLVVTATTLITSQAVPKPDNSPALDIGKYGLVGLLNNGARIFSRGASVALGLMSWAMMAILGATLVLTLIGLVLFFTGRGLVAHATWARVIAILVSMMALLISFLTFTSAKNPPAMIALVPLGCAGYALWVLARHFQIS